MGRTTFLSKNGNYIVNDNQAEQISEGYTGKSIEKLAIFENIYDEIVASQAEISAEMDQLRKEDKTKSVKFKELMVKKLNNINIISVFKAYGLD